MLVSPIHISYTTYQSQETDHIHSCYMVLGIRCLLNYTYVCDTCCDILGPYVVNPCDFPPRPLPRFCFCDTFDSERSRFLAPGAGPKGSGVLLCCGVELECCTAIGGGINMGVTGDAGLLDLLSVVL